MTDTDRVYVVIGNIFDHEPCRVGLINEPDARVLRLVHISDTHQKHGDVVLPPGDVLVHSGDFFNWDDRRSFESQTAEISAYFDALPHRYKIFVAGNHELNFCRRSKDDIQSRLPDVVYLQDSAIDVEGLRFYGAPWTPQRGSLAYAYESPKAEIEKHWDKIPTGVDVLVTHCPPGGVLSGRMGCSYLREVVLKRVR